MSTTRLVLILAIVSFLLRGQIVPLVPATGGSRIALAQSAPRISGISVGPRAISLKSRVLRAANNPAEALEPLSRLPKGERRRMIVQFDALPDADGREALAADGVKLLQYIGNNAWYAAVDGGSDTSALQQRRVKAAWRIEAADRLAPSLYKNRIPRHAVRKDGSVALNVQAFDDADVQALAREIQSAGGVVDSVSAEFGTLFVHILPQLVWGLGLIDGVHWVEPIAPVPVPEMDRARAYLGVATVQAAPFSLTGAGVKVSVHDFDHALHHTDYFDRWVKDSDPLSVGIHPSMTAGTIAGDGSVTPAFKGMAPGATLFTFRFGDDSDDCCEANNFADIADALTSGVDIANNSWGFNGCLDLPYGDYTTQARVFDRQVLGRNSTGSKIGDPTVVVFSAGNERDGFGDNNTLDCITQTSGSFENYGTINQPKPAKNIITVGAVDSANDRMTSFSSWGPTSDGRLKPDFVAPGVHAGASGSSVSRITNCFGNPTGSSNQQCFRTTSHQNTNLGSTTFDDRYAWFSMTSAAAAMASGSAALFIEDFRATNGGRSPLPSTVKAHFIHTARDLNDSTTWYNAGPDYASGYGVLQVDDAVNQERTKNFSEATVDQGHTNTFYINVPASTTEVKVTLAWDDQAADPSGNSPALVNDLDLIVTDPNGNRAFPWTLDPASPSQAAVRTEEDHLNNVEMVTVNSQNIPSGLWKIQVKGTTVPQGPQAYSLVFSHPPAGGNVDLIVSGMKFTVLPSLTSPIIFMNVATKNQGPDDAGASITRFFLSKNTSLDNKDTLLGQRSIPPLAAGQSNVSSTSLMIPPNLPSGTYYVLAVADAPSTVAEYFEMNNTRSLTVNVLNPIGIVP